MGFDKGKDPAGRLVSNRHTCIQSERIKVQVGVFYKRNTLKPNNIYIYIYTHRIMIKIRQREKGTR